MDPCCGSDPPVGKMISGPGKHSQVETVHFVFVIRPVSVTLWYTLELKCPKIPRLKGGRYFVLLKSLNLYYIITCGSVYQD